MEQLSLSVGLSRSTDPGTSTQAARTITGRTERKILALFESGRRYWFNSVAEGLTDEEICDILSDVWPPTCKSARSRLSNKGFLVDSGERRASQRGQQMIVWKLSTERAAT